MSGVVFRATDPVDFLVVGAGAAGGVVAKELATAGFRVVAGTPGSKAQACVQTDFAVPVGPGLNVILPSSVVYTDGRGRREIHRGHGREGRVVPGIGNLG